MTNKHPPVRGIVFDLDGTLVDSGLDFDLMRSEMGLSPGQPVLEAITAMAEPQASACRAILARHEWAGVDRATAMPGARELLHELQTRRVQLAVLTRNRRAIADATLERCGLQCFPHVLGREDAPAKPDPAAIWMLCERWSLSPGEVAMVGDYRFDLEAGRRAGSRTVWYTAGQDVSQIEWSELADVQVECFTQPMAMLAML